MFDKGCSSSVVRHHTWLCQWLSDFGWWRTVLQQILEYHPHTWIKHKILANLLCFQFFQDQTLKGSIAYLLNPTQRQQPSSAAAVGSKVSIPWYNMHFRLLFGIWLLEWSKKKTGFCTLHLYINHPVQSVILSFFTEVFLLLCVQASKLERKPLFFWTYITSPIRKKSIKQISRCLPLILEQLPAQSKEVLYSVSCRFNSDFFAAAWCSAEKLAKQCLGSRLVDTNKHFNNLWNS